MVAALQKEFLQIKIGAFKVAISSFTRLDLDAAFNLT